MLDHDLADLYKVTKKRLREQVRRNQVRAARGSRKVPPYVFTEHGVCMLSSILNSERAIDVNIAIVRTFVKLRKILNSDSAFEKRLSELELQCGGKFKLVFDAIRELMSTHAVPMKRIIGLGKKDE